MEQLAEDIRDFIEGIGITTKKEKTYLLDSDWTQIKDLQSRESEYDLHNLLVGRAIQNATSLYTLAKADLKHPQVKNMLEELISLFKLHEKRSSAYLRDSDWSSLLTEDSGSRAAMKSEIEFQSTIQRSTVDFGAKIRKINLLDEHQTVAIEIFGNVPISLLQYEAMVERYPEIEDLIKAKREKFLAENSAKAKKK